MATTLSQPTDNSVTSESSFKILQRIVEHSFPIEFILAGELAQFDTFAIPSISALLHRTRQYENHGLKRLDDTKANLYGIFLNPEGSQQRQTFIDHLNWVHSHYKISNEDNIYTLLRMFLYPIEWIEQRGWRSLSTEEKDALALELIKIGHAMQITDIPESYAAMQRWQQHYRQQQERYHPDNEAVAKGMMAGVQDHFPRWMRGWIKHAVLVCLKDDQLVQALGFKVPGKLSRISVAVILKSWNLFRRVYNPWRRKKFSNGWFVNYYPSYQGKFSYAKMGPEKLLAARDKKGGCPFH